MEINETTAEEFEEINIEETTKKSRLTVAVVGRPNVGKSALFNKITGKRISVVENTPGVTRDRIYSEAEWLSERFTIIDTGGLEFENDDDIISQTRIQAEIAANAADVIVMVTDLHAGVTAGDREIAPVMMKIGKPIILCVNKCDSLGDLPSEIYEFYSLGLGRPFPISAVHGHGTGDLLDEIFSKAPIETNDDAKNITSKIAVVGRPNAGKSSLVNKLANENRVIVSEKAGTTREATDTVITHGGENFILIDTAGIRRKSRVRDAVEKYSVLRAYSAIDRADVIVVMIDAAEGFTEQDSKVAGYAHDKGKASVIAINKWDLIEKNDKTMSEFTKKLESDFSFMPYAPFVFISALTGQRLDRLFKLIATVKEQNCRRITTGALNDMLAYATARVQPPTDKGKRLKLYYITQINVCPPEFAIFCNHADLFHFSYQRYIENQIRETFNLKLTPVKIAVRERRTNNK